jgi:hypothetical protein
LRNPMSCSRAGGSPGSLLPHGVVLLDPGSPPSREHGVSCSHPTFARASPARE